MPLLMNITAVLTGISVFILLGLLYVYVKNLKKIKSKFTLGLMIFGVLFLLQSIVSLYFYLTMMDYYAPQVGLHVFVLTLLQTIAFLVLLIITWE